MDYQTAKRNFEYLIERMTIKLQQYAISDDASQEAVDAQVGTINTMITFFNAATEKIAALESKSLAPSLPEKAGDEAEPYIRDEAFEMSVLSLWALTEKHPHQAALINKFCTVMHETGQLEHFKTQFKYFTEYKKLKGLKYKGSFYNFLGSADVSFTDGRWNAANWEQELTAEKKGTDAHVVVEMKKETAIEKRNRSLRDQQQN